MSETELPKWKCHKVVRASKIRNIVDVGIEADLVLEHGTVHVLADFMKKHQPQLGGYFVRYADGYESYSPAQAFEDEYSMVEKCARAAHEVNRAFCAATGDDSQVPWDDAPQWQRDSCMDGVRFTLENRDAGDSANHDNWTAHKVADGWVYGPVKDPEKKEHPCLVPFDQLPPIQQAKDRLFRTVVLAIHDEDTRGEP